VTICKHYNSYEEILCNYLIVSSRDGPPSSLCLLYISHIYILYILRDENNIYIIIMSDVYLELIELNHLCR